MNVDQLLDCMPNAGSRANDFAEPLEECFAQFDICSLMRNAAFLAQVCEESGSLRFTKELADGTAYEGRADLGNTELGDGQRFKGRWLLQITGRTNYRACCSALGLDLLSHPELLEEPEGAAKSAGWYWSSRQLNRFADRDQFGALTKAINGGFNGLDDRIGHWLRIRKVLGL